MSLPHYRGPSRETDMHRANGDGKGRIEEVNQSLLEQQNDQRWVRSMVLIARTVYFVFVSVM